VLRLFADDELLALECIPVGAVVAPANENLAHVRFGREDALTQSGIVDRHVAPAQDVLSFRLDKLLDDLDAVRPRPFGLRHEQHADAVFARFRKIDPDVAANRAQMGVRHLNEDARAVAGQRIGANRAAMGKVLENLQSLIDDPVALAILYVHDTADPARIVFVARVVEPVFPGQPLVSVPCTFDHTSPISPLVFYGIGPTGSVCDLESPDPPGSLK